MREHSGSLVWFIDESPLMFLFPSTSCMAFMWTGLCDGTLEFVYHFPVIVSFSVLIIGAYYEMLK